MSWWDCHCCLSMDKFSRHCKETCLFLYLTLPCTFFYVSFLDWSVVIPRCSLAVFPGKVASVAPRLKTSVRQSRNQSFSCLTFRIYIFSCACRYFSLETILLSRPACILLRSVPALPVSHTHFPASCQRTICTGWWLHSAYLFFLIVTLIVI